jgi:hypothetical protein
MGELEALKRQLKDKEKHVVRLMESGAIAEQQGSSKASLREK